MANIGINFGKSMVTSKDITEYSEKIDKIHKKLNTATGSKKEMLGWIDFPTKYNKREFEKIKKCAKRIQANSDVLVVIGVGGSYLGAKAIIDSLTNSFYNLQDDETRKYPQIFYVGNNMNSSYINDLIELIQDKDISINVISKSGGTLEPAIAFRIFRNLLECKYGIDEAQKRIYITTSKSTGSLREIAEDEDYETFIIPDNIGGRYSVLTPVGLLPIAVSGIDIDELMAGARLAQEKYNDPSLKYNDCYKYAVTRNILYNREKNIEIMACYNPKLAYIVEWWKQLFGESEGKEGKGIFPAGAEFTKDLHSLGQYIQEGPRNLFETILWVEKEPSDIKINFEEDNLDGLNYLEGKTLNAINNKAMIGTVTAHNEGDVPNIIIKIGKLDAETIGHLIYFFEKACAVSAMLLEVNPFDQPGVEQYKNNMYKLLKDDGEACKVNVRREATRQDAVHRKK